jgi:hypothetical protein
MDGVGDSMAVVSHRKDIKTEATHYGCRVRSAEIDDIVFRNPEPVAFSDGSTLFNGTAGLIRLGKDRSEFALFHGVRIGVAGIVLSTTDTELGISGTVVPGDALRGEYYAPQAASISITTPAASEKSVFYIDGEAQTAKRDADTFVVELKAGRHHWELSDRLPVPVAPHIVRTENYTGGARVFIAAQAGATHYRLELSKDCGATWAAAETKDEPEIAVEGLSDGAKVHVRAVAFNDLHESTPGPEYPVYVTKDAPPTPAGLRVQLANGAATLTWGEVLGVTEYRLYARAASEKSFRLLYRGLDRTYVDKQAIIQAALPSPDPDAMRDYKNLIGYCVTAVNGNGESARSPIVDTNPASWRNWDPAPGEPFRRDFADDSPSASIRTTTAWPHFYPR